MLLVRKIIERRIGMDFRLKVLINFLKETSNKISDIDFFATCGLSALTNDMPNHNYCNLKINKIEKSDLAKSLKNRQINFLKKEMCMKIL